MHSRLNSPLRASLLIRGGTLVRCDGGRHGRTGRFARRKRSALQRSATSARIAPRSPGSSGSSMRPAARSIPGFVLQKGHVHLCQVAFSAGWRTTSRSSSGSKSGSGRSKPRTTRRRLPRARRASALLEMMLAGTTTILDMGTVHHYDAVFDACDRAGIRVLLLGGKTMMDAGDRVPAGLRETTKRLASPKRIACAAVRGTESAAAAFATPTRRFASSFRAPRSCFAPSPSAASRCTATSPSIPTSAKP